MAGLTVTRKVGEKVTIRLETGEDITIEIRSVNGSKETKQKVQVCVDAPERLRISRGERCGGMPTD